MDIQIIRFEDFELDRGAFVLRRRGRLVRLERIPLELLFLLAENPGRLVTREQILDRIWGKDVFLDVDNGINTAVRKIRQALKDNPENPRLLQTVPGKGYRFIRPEVADHQAGLSSVPQKRAASGAGRSTRRWQLWLGLAALLVVAAIVARPFLVRNARPSPGKDMLAVLPFVNLSGDAHEDYFVDGMTEEMITQLGSLDPRHLRVIARTSSMQYKGTRKNTTQIAQELGVNYLLEGSVRREGERVRVTAQLIQASDQTHVWAGSFDREQGGVVKLQSEVALAIADKIELSLSREVRERLAAAPPVNPEAHLAYLQALQVWDSRTVQGAERSIAELQRAISLDPNYALAYAGLARVYSLAPITGVLSGQEAMPKAREAASRAIALDDSLAEGHTALAFVKSHYEYDWAGAQREYLRALELNPNDAYTHLFYSNSYLSPLGRHEEAIVEMKKAIELDPFSPPVQSFLGRTYLWARRYDDALVQSQKCNQMFPGFAINHERLAHLYTYIGKFQEAILEDSRARLLAGEDSESVSKKESSLQQAWKSRGPHGYWQQLLEFAHMPDNPPEAYKSAYGLAVLYTRLGEKEKAIQSLERAYQERELAMTEIGVEPALDSLRSDSRFQTLLRRVGLRQ